MSLNKTYNKALKVINSCENSIQLYGGINYCHIFKNYCDKMGMEPLLTKIYYDRLIDIANDKINELN
tara:strand:- start:12608 stop:12808 length:201 start_codon:yes stop_codon:yes gene_type:complete